MTRAGVRFGKFGPRAGRQSVARTMATAQGRAQINALHAQRGVGIPGEPSGDTGPAR